MIICTVKRASYQRVFARVGSGSGLIGSWRRVRQRVAQLVVVQNLRVGVGRYFGPRGRVRNRQLGRRAYAGNGV